MFYHYNWCRSLAIPSVNSQIYLCVNHGLSTLYFHVYFVFMYIVKPLVHGSNGLLALYIKESNGAGQCVPPPLPPTDLFMGAIALHCMTFSPWEALLTIEHNIAPNGSWLTFGRVICLIPAPGLCSPPATEREGNQMGSLESGQSLCKVHEKSRGRELVARWWKKQLEGGGRVP